MIGLPYLEAEQYLIRQHSSAVKSGLDRSGLFFGS